MLSGLEKILGQDDEVHKQYVVDNNNSLLTFFKSLLPDVEDFDKAQIRKFKRRVCSLIDEIIDENES